MGGADAQPLRYRSILALNHSRNAARTLWTGRHSEVKIENRELTKAARSMAERKSLGLLSKRVRARRESPAPLH